MAKRKIVDAHHHLWNLSSGYNYPWLQDRPLGIGVCGDVSPIAVDYLLDDLLADTADYELVKSVHIEAVARDPVAETRWLQGIADQHGFPHGIVARAELNAHDVEQTLAAHRESANLRGIRHILNWHKDPRLTFINRNDLMVDDAWLAGFALLAKYDLSFDLQVYPGQLQAAAQLAHRHPGTAIILNHAGMPVDRDSDGIARWREGISELAGAENAVAKISGLGMVNWAWTAQTIRPFVLHVIESFGPDRVMFASNFPVDRLYSSYSTLFRAFEEIVSDFSESEKDRMFHHNALVHYRLQ